MKTGAELHTRHAIVVGASKPDGIGFAIAQGLLQDGLSVTIADVTAPLSGHESYPVATDDSLGSAAKALSAYGAVDTHPCDVTDEDSVLSLFSTSVERHRQIDVVVNSVGIAVGIKPLSKLSVEEWRINLSVMADGAFLLAREAVRHMTGANVPGRIISIGSELSRTGRANASAYSAAKFALVGMTQALAEEVGPRGITANVVCPGFVETSMLQVSGGIYDTFTKHTGRSADDLRAAEIARIPMRRYTTVDDVAACVRYLASPSAGFVTGQAINVSGGSEFH